LVDTAGIKGGRHNDPIDELLEEEVKVAI